MASLENVFFILLTVQLIYYTFKLSVEILGVVGLRDKITAMFDYVYNCFRQPTNHRNNDNGEQDEADVVHEDLDVEAAPIQDQTRANVPICPSVPVFPNVPICLSVKVFLCVQVFKCVQVSLRIQVFLCVQVSFYKCYIFTDVPCRI